MTNSNERVVIDIPKDFSEVGVHGIPWIKGDIGENLGYESHIAESFRENFWPNIALPTEVRYWKAMSVPFWEPVEARVSTMV